LFWFLQPSSQGFFLFAIFFDTYEDEEDLPSIAASKILKIARKQKGKRSVVGTRLTFLAILAGENWEKFSWSVNQPW